MEGRSSTPNPEKSPALSRAGSSTSLRSRASKRQHGGCSSLNGSQGNLTATELMCPVCFELLEEAHITRCGHTFCYRCIAKSLESSGRCPKCSFVVGGIDQVCRLIPPVVIFTNGRCRLGFPQFPAQRPGCQAQSVRCGCTSVGQRWRRRDSFEGIRDH